MKTQNNITSSLNLEIFKVTKAIERLQSKKLKNFDVLCKKSISAIKNKKK